MKNSDTLYQQIYDSLLEEIDDGVYANGKQLPTEIEVAKKYFVSRITSKKALNQLAQDGVIVRIPGRGSFIKNDCSIPTILRNKSKNHSFIGLVMGGYGSSFGLDIINGAIDRAEELGLHLIVKSTGNDQKREAVILKSLMDSNVSGIIVQPAHGELYNKTLLNAVYSKYPIVMIDRTMKGIDAPFIGVDNCRLSKDAVLKLIGIGHRNIALLALEDERSSSLEERMQGFLEAFMDSHIAVKRDLWLMRISDNAKNKGLRSTDYATHETFVDVIADHLSQNPEITAIFGTEYSVSKAAWDAVRRIGKNVPKDISIVSFDYDQYYLGLHQLSHIYQPQREIGRCAVEVLNEILCGKTPAKKTYLLNSEWVEGVSISPPANLDIGIASVN